MVDVVRVNGGKMVCDSLLGCICNVKKLVVTEGCRRLKRTRRKEHEMLFDGSRCV